MDCTVFVQDKDHWLALVYTVMNIRLPQKAEKLFTVVRQNKYGNGSHRARNQE
jgi:hypothetical protein